MYICYISESVYLVDSVYLLYFRKYMVFLIPFLVDLYIIDEDLHFAFGI